MDAATKTSDWVIAGYGTMVGTFSVAEAQKEAEGWIEPRGQPIRWVDLGPSRRRLHGTETVHALVAENRDTGRIILRIERPS